MLLLQSEATAARRRLPLYLVDDTDGKTPETGLTFSAGEVKVSKDGAAEANHAGSFTEVAGGLYYYEATQGELDTLGSLTVRIAKTGVRAFVALAQVVAFSPYDAAGLGLSRLDAAVGTRAPESGGNLASVKAKTDALPVSPAAEGTAASAAAAAASADARALDLQGRVPAALSSGRMKSVAEVVSDKTGFSLASGGLDSISAPEPTGKPTTFVGWIMWLVQGQRRATMTSTQRKVLTEAGAVVTTQPVSDDGTTQALDAPV